MDAELVCYISQRASFFVVLTSKPLLIMKLVLVRLCDTKFVTPLVYRRDLHTTLLCYFIGSVTTLEPLFTEPFFIMVWLVS